MNRRSFLQILGAAAAGAVLDPERLLWVPGQKTIILPAVQRFEGRALTLKMLEDAMRSIAMRGVAMDQYMASPTIIDAYNRLVGDDAFNDVDVDKRLPNDALVLGGRLNMLPARSNREIARLFAKGEQRREIEKTIGTIKGIGRSGVGPIFHVSLDDSNERGATVVMTAPLKVPA